MKKNKTMIVVFLTPAVLLFLGIFLYPIIRTVIMSFFKIDGVTDSMDLWKFVGFGNYTKLMSTSLFKTSFFNLFRIWLIGGLVVMSLSLLFAVILTSGIRGKKFFRAIIYMPNFVSAVALATMWLQYVYSPRYGLLKDLFTALHLDNLAKIQFLDNDHKFWALLFAYCFGMVGYHMLIWLSGIERISPEYYEKLSDVKMPASKLELLVKMLRKQIMEYGKTNQKAAKKYQEKLEETIKQYHERRKLLTAEEAGEAQEQTSEEIIRNATEQALRILREMNADRESFRKIGLTFEEKAFYDILMALRDEYNFEYGKDKIVDGISVNEKCSSLARNIKEIIDAKSSLADWLHNHNVRDQLKFDIKVCLIKNGYPPQYSPEVFRKVMEQVENIEEHSSISGSGM